MPWDNELRFILGGQSRIFVMEESHIWTVMEVMDDLNRRIHMENFESLYPAGLVTVWKGDINDLVYNGKFDFHIPNLIQHCGFRGVGIICRTEAPKKWIEV